ncbi:ankyrin repeat domain-containing protein [Tenacibaculum maritimum]|uniref:Ankyrin n=1 Tax=Tenacibaculum maritimum NCIMB 2154 TaxID=1349785 RepID=A0A2H1EBN2_9FLAO|nr:ankyrin repeat domain-containing protein [Tenacibaculum maritimum]SFZ83966.1 Ankyrin [Tenacibaculum maritimum] [Tenacibaculum maritimum NCIMB 2154]
MKKNITLLCLLLCSVVLYAQDTIFDYSRIGNTEAIKRLYKENAKIIDTLNNKGFTPLILAVYNNQEATVDFLLAHKAATDVQDIYGNTALMGACFKGYEGIVKKLIAHGTDVNKRNYNQATALIFAATFGHAAIVKALIAYGADVSLQDSRGNTALDHARMQENEEILRILEK